MVKNTHCCCKVDGIVRKYENKIQQGNHQILTRCPLSRTSALHGLDGSVLAVLLPAASLPLTGFMPVHLFGRCLKALATPTSWRLHLKPGFLFTWCPPRASS